ncbi:MAG: hypothetical protein J6P44_05005 [Bacteroidales bacterium]|nr:hypothetical protein [Bacteroidales bacterium]
MKAKLLLALGVFVLFVSCGSKTPPPLKEKPINITIFLDLSDRIMPEKQSNGMQQMEKDTALIGFVRDWFINRQVKNKLGVADKIQIVFHPEDGIPNIDSLSKNLALDMTMTGKKSIALNKQKLISMPTVWNTSLNSIYSNILSTCKKLEDFPGSDIWGFFDTEIDEYIKKDYRNVIIILTDGYIFYEYDQRPETPSTVIKEYNYMEAKNYSYIEKLTPCNQDLENLEVLMLEVNPKANKDFSKMKSILENWFKDMDCQRVIIKKVALPNKSKQVIDNFLNGD